MTTLDTSSYTRSHKYLGSTVHPHRMWERIGTFALDEQSEIVLHNSTQFVYSAHSAAVIGMSSNRFFTMVQVVVVLCRPRLNAVIAHLLQIRQCTPTTEWGTPEVQEPIDTFVQ